MTSPRDPRCMSPRQFLRYVEEIEGTWGLHKGKRRISDRGFDLFWEHQKELLLSMFPNQDEKSAYEECKRLFQQESISQCTGILTYARRRARRLIGQEWEKIRTMPIGWISKRTLNAGAIAVPAGGNIIVLDSSFWVDLPFIVMFILHEWFDRGGELDRTEALEFGSRILQQVLNLGVGSGMQRLPWYSCNDPGTLTLAGHCVGRMVLVVLLHECAHVLRGHLSPKNLRTPHPWDDQERWIKYYNKEHQEEYEADRVAAEWYADLISRSSTDWKVTSYIAVVLLFELLGLIETVLGAGSTAVRTHPPAESRFAEIYNGVLERTELLEKVTWNFRNLFTWLRQFHEWRRQR